MRGIALDATVVTRRGEPGWWTDKWAAIGVSADAGYAKLNDETPVTVANALVKLADALAKGIGLIAADAHVSVAEVTPNFVWSLILSTVVFMGLSFLVKHDG